MQTEKILLTLTVPAAAALTPKRFVDVTGNMASAGERSIGVANASYDAGEMAGVATHGAILVEAGAAIAAGAEVESDASGRAITKNTGVSNGVALDAAGAAGDVIRVLR